MAKNLQCFISFLLQGAFGGWLVRLRGVYLKLMSELILFVCVVFKLFVDFSDHPLAAPRVS